MAMCNDCKALTGLGVSGRKKPPHAALVPVGELREIAVKGMRADEQDYRCTECGQQWIHETGNAGQGWIAVRRSD
ncbi:hypothetical protein [Arthrobacter sp. efr-133-TYG-118]|uniref:hypothetical protein n=1 Tax=Arthrobacter sp. efr-133-TYG-118 TaxID=3040279 RepID=UPI0025506E1D|nr:hypothetical protein [Arthrobacter sp. efr-133-TYG-118]